MLMDHHHPQHPQPRLGGGCNDSSPSADCRKHNVMSPTNSIDALIFVQNNEECISSMVSAVALEGPLFDKCNMPPQPNGFRPHLSDPVSRRSGAFTLNRFGKEAFDLDEEDVKEPEDFMTGSSDRFTPSKARHSEQTELGPPPRRRSSYSSTIDQSHNSSTTSTLESSFASFSLDGSISSLLPMRHGTQDVPLSRNHLSDSISIETFLEETGAAGGVEELAISQRAEVTASSSSTGRRSSWHQLQRDQFQQQYTPLAPMVEEEPEMVAESPSSSNRGSGLVMPSPWSGEINKNKLRSGEGAPPPAPPVYAVDLDRTPSTTKSNMRKSLKQETAVVVAATATAIATKRDRELRKNNKSQGQSTNQRHPSRNPPRPTQSMVNNCNKSLDLETALFSNSIYDQQAFPSSSNETPTSSWGVSNCSTRSSLTMDSCFLDDSILLGTFPFQVSIKRPSAGTASTLTWSSQGPWDDSHLYQSSSELHRRAPGNNNNTTHPLGRVRKQTQQYSAGSNMSSNPFLQAGLNSQRFSTTEDIISGPHRFYMGNEVRSIPPEYLPNSAATPMSMPIRRHDAHEIDLSSSFELDLEDESYEEEESFLDLPDAADSIRGDASANPSHAWTPPTHRTSPFSTTSTNHAVASSHLKHPHQHSRRSSSTTSAASGPKMPQRQRSGIRTSSETTTSRDSSAILPPKLPRRRPSENSTESFVGLRDIISRVKTSEDLESTAMATTTTENIMASAPPKPALRRQSKDAESQFMIPGDEE